ncbi:MAG TPA: hypothetical protein VGO16_02200 [Pseudonocardiaceae bacterium]|nr:hypothetical protein [Pseudonocardiaceae bacterium]
MAMGSRAEISAAAMSERAECVMLNKGPYIEDAISALDNVLRRMSEHHCKKNALLRCLRSWRPDTSESEPDDLHSTTEPSAPLDPSTGLNVIVWWTTVPAGG